MGGKERGQNASDVQPVRIRGVIEHPDCAVLQGENIFYDGYDRQEVVGSTTSRQVFWNRFSLKNLQGKTKRQEK